MTVPQKLVLLYRTKPYFSDKQKLAIYTSNVMSQMEYCSPVLRGGGSVASGMLDNIQSRAWEQINNPIGNIPF